MARVVRLRSLIVIPALAAVALLAACPPPVADGQPGPGGARLARPLARLLRPRAAPRVRAARVPAAAVPARAPRDRGLPRDRAAIGGGRRPDRREDLDRRARDARRGEDR